MILSSPKGPKPPNKIIWEPKLGPGPGPGPKIGAGPGAHANVGMGPGPSANFWAWARARAQFLGPGPALHIIFINMSYVHSYFIHIDFIFFVWLDLFQYPKKY